MSGSPVPAIAARIPRRRPPKLMHVLKVRRISLDNSNSLCSITFELRNRPVTYRLDFISLRSHRAIFAKEIICTQSWEHIYIYVKAFCFWASKLRTPESKCKAPHYIIYWDRMGRCMTSARRPGRITAWRLRWEMCDLGFRECWWCPDQGWVGGWGLWLQLWSTEHEQLQHPGHTGHQVLTNQRPSHQHLTNQDPGAGVWLQHPQQERGPCQRGWAREVSRVEQYYNGTKLWLVGPLARDPGGTEAGWLRRMLEWSRANTGDITTLKLTPHDNLS